MSQTSTVVTLMASSWHVRRLKCEHLEVKYETYQPSLTTRVTHSFVEIDF